MKLRDMYAAISCKEQILINFEFSLRYEEYDIERYFNRDVIAIEALGEHVIGLKIEGYAQEV